MNDMVEIGTRKIKLIFFRTSLEDRIANGTSHDQERVLADKAK